VLIGEGRYWRNLQNKRHGIILLPGFGRHLGVAAILLFMVHGGCRDGIYLATSFDIYSTFFKLFIVLTACEMSAIDALIMIR
jgi:hypothetical protein